MKTVWMGVVFGLVLSGCATESDVRVNEIQVIGTHNSYHAGLTQGVAKLLQGTNPKAFEGLDYAHSGLTDQLNHGIRQVELDIFGDAKGGRFSHPFGATSMRAVPQPMILSRS
jgi:hypothetical protein